jgi:dipeptidase D
MSWLALAAGPTNNWRPVMSSPLESLEPKLLWQHFDTIRQIPRPSKHEEKIIEGIKSWAADSGFEVLQDAAGSLAIKVPATPGHEDAQTIILQGHVDMVCEKNSDVEHDFMTQGIEVEVDGDWVQAKGTTLGADNGIGVAAGMAIANDPDVVHGPLELLCTVDEETGLTGAKDLDPSIVSGRIMLNLDTEEDGAVYIGCAGGADTIANLKTARRTASLGSVPMKISVTGLRGGHSALNIIDNRGHAI